MDWFYEYRKMTQDERDYYKDYIYDEEQITIVLDYDRFIESLKMIATSPEVLCKQTNKFLNLAEEVALSFDNELLHISRYYFEKGYIDVECMQKIEKMNILFSMVNQDTNNDWSVNYMIHGETWICIRTVANEILSELERG